jgi:hypothetical protein
MSTKNQVYKLEQELAFWQRVHQYERKDEIEFDLENQIRQLENRDEFGTPRYNGHIEDDEPESFTPSPPTCKYCGKQGLRWAQVDGKWRLKGLEGLHTCPEYAEKKAAARNRDFSSL